MQDTAGQSVVHLSWNQTTTCEMRAFLRANLLSCMCVRVRLWVVLTVNILLFRIWFCGTWNRLQRDDRRRSSRKLLHSLGPLTLRRWKLLSTETEHLYYLSSVSKTEQTGLWTLQSIYKSIIRQARTLDSLKYYSQTFTLQTGFFFWLCCKCFTVGSRLYSNQKNKAL